MAPKLVSAVRGVAAGNSLIDPALTAGVMERLPRKARTSETPSSPRQEATNPGPDSGGKDEDRQMSAEMFLAEKTVRSLCPTSWRNKSFSRRTEAAVYAALAKPAKHDHEADSD